MTVARKKTRLIHKQKRNLNKKRSFFIKVILNFFLFIFSIIKTRPRVLSIFLTALFFSILIWISVKKINSYSETFLPVSSSIEINNAQIYSLVNDDISKAIFNAQKNHEKRSHFLNRIHNILFSYDRIDQYWIRLGFDRKLQINATLQVPFLILETKGGDKYVVSSTSEVIAKNPDSYEYPGLYVLSTPEIKLTWKPKSLQQKNKLNFSNNVKLLSTNKDIVNLPWLVNETKIIYTGFQELGLNYFLNKISWNSGTGFQLNLVEQKNSSLPGTSQANLNVLLGKENFVSKIKELKTILNDLNQKNLHPMEIDLDYIDKATFKVSNLSN
ncbi:MAG: hypothetical protein V4591_00285 [Bdellovibrionota bacterium]